ncbi:hypothetical protein SLEP1_g12880 [Rubroshorea leprosula]|uniref:DUF4408 domain-containing protein n=1 Tax=Rubroshorea leprosula TaxID=152421 RepID=A0AAV5ILY1_9ROSI|nr:hypothetical protein SLEP1_g12880 [Rubroshorea leprosula]
MLEESMSVPSIWASMFSWCTPAVLFLFLNLIVGTIFITSGFLSNKSGDTEQQKQPDSPHRLARSPSILQRLKSINFRNYRSQEPITGFEKSPHLDVDSQSFSFQQTPEQKPQTLRSRSPSMLQRLKSISFSNYISQEPTSDYPETAPKSDTHYPPEQTYEQDQPQIEQEEEVNEEKQQIEEEEQIMDQVYSKLKEADVKRTKSDTKPASGEIPTKLPQKMKKSASAKSAFSHSEEEDIVESRRPQTARASKAKVSEEDDEGVDAKADDFINKFKNQLKLQRIDSFIRNSGSGK